MKETYFLPETIRSKTQEMLLRVEYVSNRKNRCLSAARSAVIVLDMQSYFLNRDSHAFIPSSLAIIPNIVFLIQAYTTNRMPVFLTRHVNDSNNKEIMAKWWNDTISEDNPLSVILPEIADSKASVIIKKTYDAFYDTSLENELKSKGIEQVAICGVMTHLCCETTARSAFVRGFEVFFIVDGTATYNEQFHCATLLNIAHGFAQLVTVEELISILPKGNLD